MKTWSHSRNGTLPHTPELSKSQKTQDKAKHRHTASAPELPSVNQDSSQERDKKSPRRMKPTLLRPTVGKKTEKHTKQAHPYKSIQVCVLCDFFFFFF